MTYRLEMAGGHSFLIDEKTRNDIIGLLNGPPIASRAVDIDDHGGKGKVAINVSQVVAIRLNTIAQK